MQLSLFASRYNNAIDAQVRNAFQIVFQFVFALCAAWQKNLPVVQRAAGRQAVAVAGREGRGWRGAGGERARARVRAHRGRASGRTSWVNTTWSRRC